MALVEGFTSYNVHSARTHLDDYELHPFQRYVLARPYDKVRLYMLIFR